MQSLDWQVPRKKCLLKQSVQGIKLSWVANSKTVRNNIAQVPNAFDAAALSNVAWAMIALAATSFGGSELTVPARAQVLVGDEAGSRERRAAEVP